MLALVGGDIVVGPSPKLHLGSIVTVHLFLLGTYKVLCGLPQTGCSSLVAFKCGLGLLFNDVLQSRLLGGGELAQCGSAVQNRLCQCQSLYVFGTCLRHIFAEIG